jgi:hypothetical protein
VGRKVKDQDAVKFFSGVKSDRELTKIRNATWRCQRCGAASTARTPKELLRLAQEHAKTHDGD